MTNSSPPQVGEAFLSPKSRVAKMLADIDNDTDSDEIPLYGSKTSRAGEERPLVDTEVHSPARSLLASRSIFQQDDIDQSEEDDEDQIPQLRGRAAKRMRRHSVDSLAGSPISGHSLPDQQSYGTPNDSGIRRAEEDENLYSATPAAKRRALSRKMPLSPLASQSSGNGLFISPAKPEREDSNDLESDHELPANPVKGNQKLAQLVAEKKAERLAKEAEREHIRRQGKGRPDDKSSKQSDIEDDALHSSDQTQDNNIDRILSDAARPTRKASKKALLEMERETQRLARQQALTHRMEVKKKFTTNDLFAKFNYRQDNVPQLPTVVEPELAFEPIGSSGPNSDGTAPHSDDSIPTSTRRLYIHSTPPSSPPSPLDREREKVEQGALSKLTLVREDTLGSLAEGYGDEELPDARDFLQSKPSTTKLDNIQIRSGETATAMKRKSGQRGLKLAKWGKNIVTDSPAENDSDDDLEVEPPLPRHLKAFRNAHGATKTNNAKSNALHHLRYLSSIGIDTHNANRRKGTKQASMTVASLEAKLRKRALLLARQAQEERLGELRAKGITIQTAEEREREAEEFENLLEKARQDAVALKEAEKAARKTIRGETTSPEHDAASSDESEDRDYEESGSEDEPIEVIDDLAEDTDEGDEDAHVEDVKAIDLVEEVLVQREAENSGSTTVSPNMKARATRRSRMVLDDDDESDFGSAEPAISTTQALISQNEDPFAAFGFGSQNAAALMSTTQAFNATMQTPTQLTQQDSMDAFNQYAPPPTFLSLPPTLHAPYRTQANATQRSDVVPGSQVAESQRVDLAIPSPETPAPATARMEDSTLSALETPGWEPSQDPGLPSPFANAKGPGNLNFTNVDDNATQSTVPLKISESPGLSTTRSSLQHKGRHGRLIKRRREALSESEDDDNEEVLKRVSAKKNAFAAMAKKRLEALTAAERAKAERELRGIMDDQAEESEDEYAGLGGDDYVAPETAEDNAMIDSSVVEVDERSLAAHHAERERLRMEQETNQLFKDLTTGALRRRGGMVGDWELEDDEGEVVARRRQMKQREEARKRKLLLQDESLAGLAEGKLSKGKDAFLKAIADDEDDDDADSSSVDLSDVEVEISGPSDNSQLSQGQQQHGQLYPLTETSGNAVKIPLPSATSNNDYETIQSRPPAKSRRTKPSELSKRPSGLLEVRESLSFLLDDASGPTELVGPTALELSDNMSGSEDEYDGPLSQMEREDEAIADLAQEEARSNDGGYAPGSPVDKMCMPPPPRPPASERRTKAPATIIDRLNLRRNASSSSNSSVGSNGVGTRSAWATMNGNGAFRVPSLLRRATTSSASTSSNDRGVTTSNSFSARSGAAATNSSKVSIGNNTSSSGGKSSLAAQARAEERKAIVEASARRRAENTRKVAELRRAATVGSGGGVGSLARGFGTGGGGGFE